MRRIFVIVITIVLGISCKNKAVKTEQEVKKEPVVEKKVTIPVVETVFSSQDIRPCNIAMNTQKNVYVSINPLTPSNTKVFKLNIDGANTGEPYPNDDLVTGKESQIKAIIGIKTDSKGNLWMLDMANKQFLVWNTGNNALEKTLKIPADVTIETSFLQDFVIDEKHNRVIIADMTQGDLKSAPLPAFIVINIETGEAKRMAQGHQSMLPEIEGGFALNPIAIDPSYNYIYFGALNGRTIYRVPAQSFESEEQLRQTIEKFGEKSFSDGIAVDANENVYVTNIEKNEIGIFNKENGFKTLAKLPENQSWPDGLHVANDGYLYGTVDQLNRTAALNNGKDESTGPYLVVRTKLSK